MPRPARANCRFVYAGGLVVDDRLVVGFMASNATNVEARQPEDYAKETKAPGIAAKVTPVLLASSVHASGIVTHSFDPFEKGQKTER